MCGVPYNVVSCIFQSCIFHPCSLVPHLGLAFSASPYQRWSRQRPGVDQWRHLVNIAKAYSDTKQTLSLRLRRDVGGIWEEIADSVDENSPVDAADCQQRLSRIYGQSVRTTESLRWPQHITEVLQPTSEQLHPVVVTVGDQQVTRAVDI